MKLEVLRSRAQLSPIALQCADLALHCAERSRLDQPRSDGTRLVLVWSETELLALFPFSAPALYRGLPLIALRSPTPLVRKGAEPRAVHALLDWFRGDGEGAALLEIRALAPHGPVCRAFAEVARQREQHVLAAMARDGTRKLLVSDHAWGEHAITALPLERWAKRRTAGVVYRALDF